MKSATEVVKGLYAAFATGDVPAVVGALAPQASWTEAAGFPYAGTYVGPEAILQNVFARLGSEWDGYSAVPAEYVSEGNTVVTLGTYSGKYLATGKSFEAPFVHVWRVQDGQVVSFVQHTDTVLVQAALQP